MAEDQDRAARIGELKDAHPRLTWAEIARRVGVSERAATQWRRTGALKPENAEALAHVFGVDFDFIWTGPRPDTPNVFVDRRTKPASPVAVHRVEGPLEERLIRIEETLNVIATAIVQINERLETALDQAGGEYAAAASRVLRDEGEALAERLRDTTRRIFEAAERDAQTLAATRDRRAKSRSAQD